jgi:O-antigen ligase
VTIISTSLSILREIDPVVGVSVQDRTLRTLVTLFIGCGFYFVVALVPDSPEKLRSSLRWLYASFGIALLWGSLQAVYVIYFQPNYFELIRQVQRLISTRKLFPTRISGMTYEPNWFAEQIVFLLMPWLFTAVFSGYSAFQWRGRWRWVSVELFLLLWAAGVLIFTYSRSGMILFGVQLVLVLLFRSKSLQDKKPLERTTKWKFVGKRLMQASLAIIMFATVVFYFGSRNNYFSRLWNYWTDEESTGQYLQYIAFEQRFAYWETAFRLFEANPIIGVGLGNFTFFLDEYLPVRPLHPTPELLIKLTPEEGRSQLTSVKGVIPRLLAETGLLGVATFLGFLTALVGCAIYLVLSNSAEGHYWGRVGLLGLVVFLIVSFSFDSFSLPNMWVMFGFITASAQIFG